MVFDQSITKKNVDITVLGWSTVFNISRVPVHNKNIHTTVSSRLFSVVTGGTTDIRLC